MGITGLLPFIKNSCRPANLRDFKGETVAIDAYSWLHKGAFSCAEKLVKGEKTDGYIFYCTKLLNMLLDVGVKPIMVFDGSNLPSKETTENKRRENREKSRQRGKELLCEGRTREARECFQRCVDVTPEMAREVIQMCKKKNIDCIVAPYEADAQLAYLDKIGMAQIIITEDSDLVLFGCRKILFKMDSNGGGLLYEKENLPNSLSSNASKFTFEKFRFMCILSGCDYLASLPGIGLGKAFKFFKLTNNPDLIAILRKLPSYLKMPGLEVSEEYIDSFVKANNTFLYQLVYCPKKKGLVPLNPYPENMDASDMAYAGKYLPDDLAVELAMGNINVKTMERFDDTENKDSSYDQEKSVVWGTAVVMPVKKFESAFKFNSQKTKPVKRKIEATDTPKSNRSERISEDEELFSMYRSNDPQKDILEEDPLADVYEQKLCLSPPIEQKNNLQVPENSQLSLKRIVKSKFFVTPSKKTPEVLRENSPEKLCNKNKNPTSMTAETSDADLKIENVIHSPVKFNKENIIHRFAKKKVENKASISFSSEDISSLQKVGHSWIDVIDTETPLTTSSSITSLKFFGHSEDMNSSSTNIKSSSLKVKKTKLISTRILDFKWKRESSLKQNLNSSLQSDGNSEKESVADSDVEEVLDSLENDSSFDGTAKSTDNCVSQSVLSTNSDDLPSSSSSGDSVSTDLAPSQGSSSPKTLILKPPSARNANKAGKCRRIGLSKKSKTPTKKLSLQDTLLNFHFVRKSKSEVSVTT